MISNYGSLSCACPHNERQLPQKDQDAKNPTEQTIWSSWHNQKRNSRRHREPTLCQASADRSSSCSRPASGSGAWIWTSIPETCYLQNSWNCDTMCFWKSWLYQKKTYPNATGLRSAFQFQVQFDVRSFKISETLLAMGYFFAFSWHFCSSHDLHQKMHDIGQSCCFVRYCYVEDL